jgi:3-hydroxyisobutyrate dehydrogenase-like beta-hydroxyacid dehydrogenase
MMKETSMTTASSRRVSVLGLGMMGAALAEALLNAGHNVTVWNRSPAKAEPLAAKGARAAASAAEALAASDIAILCVLDHAASMEVLGTNPEAVPGSGRCLVELTTMTPADSRETASWAAAHGLSYLEGSIIGVPGTVTSRAATIVVAGPRDLFEVAESVLQAFGGGKHVSEEIGAAVSFDRVYYAYTYGVQLSFLQGAAMAHAKGFSVQAFTDIVMARINAVKNGFGEMGANIAARDHRLKECRADVWAAAFVETLAQCREIGVDDTLPRAIMQLFERNSAAGRGGEELSSIFETLIEGTGR